MKKINASIVMMLLSFFLMVLACQDDNESIVNNGEDGNETTEADAEGSDDSTSDALADNSGDHEDESDYSWDENDVTTIELTGASATISGNGASVNGSLITISSAGNYLISGTLNDGQIMVETDDDETLRLILNGVNITNSTNAPIAIMDAEKTIIILPDGTNNYLTDASSYVFESSDEDEPNAALFSKDDLTIYGEGKLTINANYNDAIASKDGLIIKSGNISVTAADDGIRGKDYLIIKDGNIVVDANDDGLKSDNEDDETLGYILIENGTINITSDGDAMQAQTDLLIVNGDFDITTGGGSNYGYNEDTSAKGLKADVSIVIDTGTFTIESADDAIHSNKSISINGGDFDIATGDDGIHADSAIGIHGGKFQITKSYEGIESAIIIIDDGEINIVASDDGINVAGGNDGSSMNRPGGGGFGGFQTTNNNYCLYINGGYVAINADGDGLDSNGSIEMTGGTVIVHGPTSNGDGTLDYDGSFTLDGGVLVGAGSSGMVQTPGSSSEQYSVLIGFTSTMNAGELVHIENEDGDNILTFAPAKRYQALIFSSSSLEQGKTYKIYYGGSSTSAEKDGLYEEGTYNAGTYFQDFTVSSTTTLINFR